jgi:beta-aspartyl-peptidase (threonine type)
VAAVERIRNPIRLARLILERSGHILLTGSGAELFALEHGLDSCDPAELITPVELERWKARAAAPATFFGTVGAVVRDAAGNIAAATSTGGTFFKYPGRVGDSPLIGCGCYADNLSAAVSCTGQGEPIMKAVLAKTTADLVAAGNTPQAAAEMALSLLSRRVSGMGGLIVLDRHGATGVAFSTPHMSWGLRTVSEERVVG